jgi:hypothetical protein
MWKEPLIKGAAAASLVITLLCFAALLLTMTRTT